MLDVFPDVREQRARDLVKWVDLKKKELNGQTPEIVRHLRLRMLDLSLIACVCSLLDCLFDIPSSRQGSFSWIGARPVKATMK